MKTNKTIRLRTEPGSSKNITVKIQQEFDTIDFLSLKITQDEAYRNFCSDYGVVAGRVIANDGFGIENAKISIFIPLKDEDAKDPIISTLYPYVTTLDTNTQGIRYNLLPRVGKNFKITVKIPNKSTGTLNTPDEYFASPDTTPLGTFVGPWSFISITVGVGEYSIWEREIQSLKGPTVPVGTFPTKFEVLGNDSLLEIHDKYYKYTTKTNRAGDYMIFGVPLGTKLVHMDVDVSDTGSASITPNDLINIGLSPSLFDGNKFKSSTNLSQLPQIETQNISVDVIPFWGNPEQCEIGITRVDFNLTKEISPSSVFICATFTNGGNWRNNKNNSIEPSGVNNDRYRSTGCMEPTSVTVEGTGGGGILPQTFSDGLVIYNIPMYGDKFVTNEFGDYEASTDPNKGIPTSGTYTLYVYSTQQNCSNTDSEQSCQATHVVPTQKYRYDLNNKKRLVYTPALAIFSDINPNGNSLGIGSNTFECGDKGNRNSFPTTYSHLGEDRFGSWYEDGEPEWHYAMSYGSLYFPRFKVHSNGDYCGQWVNQEPNLPGGGIFMHSGDGVKIRCESVLDITDILKFFKPFGGNLNVTSGYHGVSTFENAAGACSYPNTAPNSILPVIQKCPKSQAYPFGTTADLDSAGLVVYPNRLNKEVTDEVLTVMVLNNTSYGGQPVPSNQAGEKSRPAWYHMYFGIRYSPGQPLDVLTKLKLNSDL